MHSLDSIRDRKASSAAVSYLKQAQDFFEAAALSRLDGAKPLLTYYSFLNLAKAFILQRTTRTQLQSAHHGLSEPNRSKPFSQHRVLAQSRRNQVGIFQEFSKSLATDYTLRARKYFNVSDLLAQNLFGHRLYCGARGINERFLPAINFEFCEDKSAKRIWLRSYIFSDDLADTGLSQKAFLNQAKLAQNWQFVRSNDLIENRRPLCIEQINPIPYSGRPADKIQGLVNSCRNQLWTMLLTTSQPRKYYFYAASANEHILPQALSYYALVFYLGSITRYRPLDFQKLISGKYGPVIFEILNEQPMQFIYLMAGEFIRNNVVKSPVL